MGSIQEMKPNRQSPPKPRALAPSSPPVLPRRPLTPSSVFTRRTGMGTHQQEAIDEEDDVKITDGHMNAYKRESTIANLYCQGEGIAVLSDNSGLTQKTSNKGGAEQLTIDIEDVDGDLLFPLSIESTPRASVNSAHHPMDGLWSLGTEELPSGDSTSYDKALALPTSQQGEKLTSGGRRLPQRTAYMVPARGSASLDDIRGCPPSYRGSPFMHSFASGDELDAIRTASINMTHRFPTSNPRFTSLTPRTESLMLWSRNASMEMPYGSVYPPSPSPVRAGLMPRMQSLQLGGLSPPVKSSSSRTLVTSPQAPMDGLTLRRMGIPTRESASPGIALARPASHQGMKIAPSGRVLPRKTSGRVLPRKTASMFAAARGHASCNGSRGGTPPYQGSPFMQSFASGEELDAVKRALRNTPDCSPTSYPRSMHPRTESLMLGLQEKDRRASIGIPYASVSPPPPSSSPVKASLIPRSSVP
eukprot:gene22377-29481_t